MIAKKQNSEKLFWTLQLVGWLTIGAMSFITGYEWSTNYLIYSYISFCVMGIALTSIFRWYLKYRVKIDWYGKSALLHLIIATCVCIVAYMASTYVTEFIYESFWERTEAEIESIKQFVTLSTTAIGASVTIISWTSIYYALKIYMRRGDYHAEQLELKTTLREAQLNTLKGQVNPHFMFNSLNNIRGLMLEDVEKSREMITKLSEMLEYALEKNIVDAIPVEQELEMVENYIALSKIQMEDRLKFVKKINPETLSINIPPMIIQLLIENAAKHGIANLKDGGTIRLTVAKMSNEILIKVSNTGKLRIAKDSTQLGLKNIRQRLRLLYGKKASFSLEEVEDEVMAQIKVPLL